MNIPPRTGVQESTNQSKGWLNVIFTDSDGKRIQIAGTQLDASSKFLTKDGRAVHSKLEALLEDLDPGEVLTVEVPLHLEIRKVDPEGSRGEVAMDFRSFATKKS